MKNPLISIIMPACNTEKYIRQCMQSILSQTYRYWELIIIDDLSTDQTYDLAHSYARKDKRIQVYRNTNKGIIPALEKAFSYSKGFLIHRMDSDDIMPPYKLHALVHGWRNHPDAITTGGVLYFNEEQPLKRGFLDYAGWINGIVMNNAQYQHIYLECTVASPAWLISRDILTEVGGITNDIYPEDYDLIFRLYAHRVPINSLPQIIHYWRDWRQRASRTQAVYHKQDFYALKCAYFFQIDRKKDSRLILWGAGKKGKKLHKVLSQYEHILWVDNNTNRWGHIIQLTEIRSPELITPEDQVIIAVSSPKSKVEIIQYLTVKGLKRGKSFFEFI